VCGDDLEMLRSASDGSTPFVWRVALADDAGNEALSLPAAFYVALPVNEVGMPDGANVFAPAHVVVPRGSRVSWRNDAVAEGNLQNAVHDVELVDAQGAVITKMVEFDAAACSRTRSPTPALALHLPAAFRPGDADRLGARDERLPPPRDRRTLPLHGGDGHRRMIEILACAAAWPAPSTRCRRWSANRGSRPRTRSSAISTRTGRPI
jgi:hypothetical protein